jgi:hypothetical protein
MRPLFAVAAAVVVVTSLASCSGSSGGGPGGGTPTAATPGFAPAGGSFTTAQTVTITDGTPGATIHYTTDGSTPTESSATYAAPVTVAASETLKAMATAPGDTPSAVASATFVITPAAPAATPVFSPGTGSYTTAQSVTITCTTPGASIFYTVDGSTPTTGSTAYAGAVQVSTTSTLKAIATAPGFGTSAVATAVLAINLTGDDFATTCAAVKSAYTTVEQGCLKASPAALATLSVRCDSLATEVQVGRIVYDASHAADCLAAVTGLSCTGLGGGGEPAACRLALLGQVASGSVCYDNADCPSGYCSAAAGACPGLCVAYAAAGGACSRSDHCAAGLACDGTSGTCKTASAAGGACPCQAGLYCNGSGLCAAQQTTGACSTTTPEQCALGTTCLGSPGPTCQPLVGAGGACTLIGGASQCGLGYQCVSSVCVAIPAVGEACTAGEPCVGGTCNGTVCVASAGSAACDAAPGLAGLTLYDAFSGPAIDGKLYQNAGVSRGVSGGAATFSLDVTDEQARSLRNDTYVSQANVVTGGARVTTLQADITVPGATAARTGGAMIRAYVRLHYSPPANRLNFPGGNQDLLVAEVGLLDNGSGGLTAFRQFSHCDDASCATRTITGIAVSDPASFTSIDGGLQFGAPAAYDTTYTATVSLDETTGIFHWTIAGGSFGSGGVSGTANPAVYLAATPSWATVPLAGTGFQVAQIGVRSNDQLTGGGSARITGKFASVKVGLNNAAATSFDDFSGTGGNSGPAELSPAKWQNGGATSFGLSGGSLLVHHQLTAPATAAVSDGQPLALASPTGVNSMQVDVAMEAFSTSGGGAALAGLQGRFYNDGSGVKANDATGDIVANLFLQGSGTVFYGIGRCTNTGCGVTTLVGSGTLPSAPIGTGGHRLLLNWSPTNKHFTFGLDGVTTDVDPTTVGGSVTVAATYGGPALSPSRSLISNASISPNFQGKSASMDARFSDLFTGP